MVDIASSIVGQAGKDVVFRLHEVVDVADAAILDEQAGMRLRRHVHGAQLIVQLRADTDTALALDDSQDRRAFCEGLLLVGRALSRPCLLDRVDHGGILIGAAQHFHHIGRSALFQHVLPRLL
ncbi:hypothetical protein [Mesorhizobium sp.]|uniref:hypothetical protein n=1 Tax=Mesorhizobium sp. TaxID=1871066 RepID=UPI0025BDE948|nr:hypothetical protein [Mesorhizobium sp.]